MSWKPIASNADIPDPIHVRVQYYKDSDRVALGGLPAGRYSFPKKDEAEIRIPKAEFLAYWLFEDKNPDLPLMADFNEIAKDADKGIRDLRVYFQASKSDVRAAAWGADQERAGDISTRLGVSVGLAVVNQFAGLTRADWNKIPKTIVGGKEPKRLDYSLAVVGGDFIAVENKGSIVKDNRGKPAHVSKHAASIRKKKEEARAANQPGVLVGTIAVADHRDDSRLQCWLLDPPVPTPDDVTPEVFKVLNRLRFHRSLIQIVFPRWKTLHHALEEREEMIARVNALEGFQGKPLVRKSGTRFVLKWGSAMKAQVRMDEDLWVGMLGPCGGDLLFIGIQKEWLTKVVEQDLFWLLGEVGESRSTRGMLEWHPTRKEVGAWYNTDAVVDGGTVLLPVDLQQTSAGFAFAVIERRPFAPKKPLVLRRLKG